MLVKTLHEGICVSPGNSTEMMITWVTFKPTVEHTVKYNVHGEPLSLNATGTMTRFTDGGGEHRVLFIHKTKLTGLTPDQQYGRSITSILGESRVHFFLNKITESQRALSLVDRCV